MNQLEKYREELMACNEKILEGLLVTLWWKN